MALLGIPLWLLLLAFVIVMILVGVLLWYFMKLMMYLLGRSQESEFDKVIEDSVNSPGLPPALSNIQLGHS